MKDRIPSIKQPGLQPPTNSVDVTVRRDTTGAESARATDAWRRQVDGASNSRQPGNSPVSPGNAGGGQGGLGR